MDYYAATQLGETIQRVLEAPSEFIVRVNPDVANVFRESYASGSPIRGVEWSGPAVVVNLTLRSEDGTQWLEATMQPITERPQHQQ